MLNRLGSQLRSYLPGGATGPGSSLVPEPVLRRLEKRKLVTGRTFGGGMAGEHRGRRLASSVEFADYRPYAAGDDFRRIDWNAYARLNELLIKIPESHEDVTLHLLLDITTSMEWGDPSKLSYGRQMCAGLGYMALSRLDAVRVGLLEGATVSRSPLFRGKGQTPQLFDFLQQRPPHGETDLDAALAAYVVRHSRSDVAFLVSDLLSPAGYEVGLMRLLQAGLRVVVIHVLSPDELEPDYGGELELLDVETGGTLQVSMSSDILERYRSEVLSWQDELRAHCVRHGVGYVPVRTDTAVEQTLLGDFRRLGLIQ